MLKGLLFSYWNVRIHDEYCESEPEAWLPRLNKIVTDAYRRRTAEGR